MIVLVTGLIFFALFVLLTSMSYLGMKEGGQGESIMCIKRLRYLAQVRVPCLVILLLGGLFTDILLFYREKRFLSNFVILMVLLRYFSFIPNKGMVILIRADFKIVLVFLSFLRFFPPLSKGLTVPASMLKYYFEHIS